MSGVVLMPCPFCGWPASDPVSNGIGSAFLECRDCGAEGPVEETEAEAVTAWNRRTDGTALASAIKERDEAYARVERLQRALSWALPLAERAVDTLRSFRVQCGHTDIRGTYADGTTWVGIYQGEVDDIEFARAALAPELAKEPS
jgi:Lar family restriction alleviation protein